MTEEEYEQFARVYNSFMRHLDRQEHEREQRRLGPGDEPDLSDEEIAMAERVFDEVAATWPKPGTPEWVKQQQEERERMGWLRQGAQGAQEDERPAPKKRAPRKPKDGRNSR
jgi:hypothetical protein